MSTQECLDVCFNLPEKECTSCLTGTEETRTEHPVEAIQFRSRIGKVGGVEFNKIIF